MGRDSVFKKKMKRMRETISRASIFDNSTSNDIDINNNIETTPNFAIVSVQTDCSFADQSTQTELMIESNILL